ncbi:restriction endonuclease subunit S [Lewinella sp. W8]|uniref:restriction endonuclease subunit S n=1 Tax=Lewinella sp. W8 TaxID=2528208 RepID=UPI0010689FC7|nr:restriction endonuclease subunit S [Lewinella sp. W8]
MIPEDWEVVTVDDVANVLTGFPFPSSKYSNSGIKLLRGSNVKRNILDWSVQITKYWPELTPDIQQYILEDGDIVIAMDGSLVGKSFAQISSADLPLLLLQRVARLRTLNIDLGYLKELICCPIFTKHCDEVKTVTAIPHISPADIKGYKIPLPPTRTEQRAIATALSDADAALAAQDALIAKKEDFKRGMMEALLSGELRLDGFNGAWEEVTLGDHLKMQVGAPFSSAYFNKKAIGLRLVKNRDLKSSDSITYYSGSFSEEFVVESGDILVGMDGDFILCWWAGGMALLNQRIGRLRFIDSTIYPGYLYYSLKGKLKEIEHATAATTVKHLSHSDVENVEITIPSLPEQRAIATVLSDLDAELAAVRARRAKLARVKAGMMEALLTGAVRLV